MDHQGTIIRPPNEGDSILLQVATGCSHNKCTFCGAYKGERFTIKDPDTVARDVQFAARHCRALRRVFLCGGDTLVLPQDRLLDILAAIRRDLPWVTRTGAYASAKALSRKSDAQLRELRAAGLGAVYLGLESGDDDVLARVRKWGDARTIIEQARRAKDAGMRLNVTVLLGLGGTDGSETHARRTGRALSAMDPDTASALTLMLMPNTPLYKDAATGAFTLPDAQGMLRELRTLLEHTRLTRGLFLANHASNYLPLKVRLPNGKADALQTIDDALAGRLALRADRVRRL